MSNNELRIFPPLKILIFRDIQNQHYLSFATLQNKYNYPNNSNSSTSGLIANPYPFKWI